MMVTIYGIRNCDTMKKARAWLEARGVSYRFHDYKVAGINHDHLQRWADEVGWETLVNRSGLTFRKLPEPVRKNLDRGRAIKLMQENPSLIKRPVLDLGRGRLLVGFAADRYAEAFAKGA